MEQPWLGLSCADAGFVLTEPIRGQEPQMPDLLQRFLYSLFSLLVSKSWQLEMILLAYAWQISHQPDCKSGVYGQRGNSITQFL